MIDKSIATTEVTSEMKLALKTLRVRIAARLQNSAVAMGNASIRRTSAITLITAAIKAMSRASARVSVI